MSNFYTGSGKKVQLSLAETGYGVAADPAFTISNTSESLSLTVDKKDSATLLTSKAPMERDIMSITAGGSLPFTFKPDFAGQLIKYALGGTDTVTSNTGVYSHSIVLADSGYLPTFSVYVDRGETVKKYSGVSISKLSLDCKAKEYVTGSIDLKAKDESNGTLNDTLPNPSLKTFKVISAALKVNGTTYDCASVNFSLDNKLQDVPSTFGSGLYANQSLLGTREATVSIEMPYDTNAESIYNNFYMTETLMGSLEVKLLSPSIITGTTPYSVTITLNNVSITQDSTNVAGMGVISNKFTGIALAVGSTEPLVIKIDDATSTAY